MNPVYKYELYGFSSFVADVGGFLGLLLGASLLSLFESCFDKGKKYFNERSLSRGGERKINSESMHSVKI